jgi:hypothetical protein
MHHKHCALFKIQFLKRRLYESSVLLNRQLLIWPWRGVSDLLCIVDDLSLISSEASIVARDPKSETEEPKDESG